MAYSAGVLQEDDHGEEFPGSFEECECLEVLANSMLKRCNEFKAHLKVKPRSDERRGSVSSGGWPRDAQWQHMGMPDAEWASSLHVWPRQTLAQPPPLFWGQPLLESQPPWQLHRQRQWQ